MFAIIELGGKQYKIQEKEILQVEKLETPEGQTFKAEKVLLISDEDKTKIGTPYLPGASVEVQVKKTGLSEKVILFKMKSKKRYKRLRGHRQPYSEIEILKISA